MPNDRYELRLAENTAAISGSFHADGRYDDVYTLCKDAVGGFPGFWAVCARAGVIVTDKEEAGGLNFDAIEWIDYVDHMVARMIETMLITGKDIDDVELGIQAERARTDVS